MTITPKRGLTEVANGGHSIAVRDTINRDGAVLAIPASAWRAFTATLR